MEWPIPGNVYGDALLQIFITTSVSSASKRDKRHTPFAAWFRMVLAIIILGFNVWLQSFLTVQISQTVNTERMGFHTKAKSCQVVMDECEDTTTADGKKCCTRESVCGDDGYAYKCSPAFGTSSDIGGFPAPTCKWANFYERYLMYVDAVTVRWKTLLFGVLLLWVTTLLKEFRDTTRFCRGILGLNGVASCYQQITYINNEIEIKGATCIVKAVTMLVVVLPKLCMNLYVGYVGTLFLSETMTVTDLVMNAVALEFILNIDELIFEGLASSHKQLTLQKTRPLILNIQNALPGCCTKWSLVSALYMILAATVVTLILTVLYGEIIETNNFVNKWCSVTS